MVGILIGILVATAACFIYFMVVSKSCASGNCFNFVRPGGYDNELLKVKQPTIRVK